MRFFISALLSMVSFSLTATGGKYNVCKESIGQGWRCTFTGDTSYTLFHNDTNPSLSKLWINGSCLPQTSHRKGDNGTIISFGTWQTLYAGQQANYAKIRRNEGDAWTDKTDTCRGMW